MQLKHATLATFFATVLLVACSGGGGTVTPQQSPTPKASGATPTPTAMGATPTPSPAPSGGISGFPQLTLEYPSFYGEAITSFPSGVNPRGLVALPNGDLLIGTGSPVYVSNNQVYIIPNAAGSAPGAPKVFATLTDGTCGDTRSLKENAQGIAFSPNSDRWHDLRRNGVWRLLDAVQDGRPVRDNGYRDTCGAARYFR